MASITDVAELAHVSIATVSRVMNNHPNVSQEKREAVRKAIADLNYIPNANAQSLVTKTTNAIGILIADISNNFYSILVRSIEDVLNEKGYYTVIGNTDWQQEKEKDYLTYFLQKQIDGFILASTTMEENYINELAHNVPVVVLDRDIESDIIDKIRVNDYKGGYLATKHLLESGYQRLIHLKGPAGIVSAEDREKGFRQCVSDFEVSDDKVSIIQGCFMENCGIEIMEKYLQNHEITDPVGIFSANDAMAFGVLHVLKKYGIKCPEEIGLIGFDDVNFSEYSSPPLTTVKRPIKEIGRIAAEIILERLQNKKNEHFKRDIKMNVKLIKRESTMNGE